METAPNVRKFLDLSTAHLPERFGAGDRPDGGLAGIDEVIAYPTTYGWLMYVPRDEGDGDYQERVEKAPIEIVTIWNRAHALGCDYVLFDQDGPTDDELPTWDW